MLFFLGLGVMLYDTFSRNRRREQIEAEEKALREEIESLLEHSELDSIELNTYIRNTTGKPGISSLNVAELTRVREYVQNRGTSSM